MTDLLTREEIEARLKTTEDCGCETCLNASEIARTALAALEDLEWMAEHEATLSRCANEQVACEWAVEGGRTNEVFGSTPHEAIALARKESRS